MAGRAGVLVLVGTLVVSVVVAVWAAATEAVVFALPEDRLAALKSAGYPGRCLAAAREQPIRLMGSLWVIRIASTAAVGVAVWALGRDLVGSVVWVGVGAVICAVLVLVVGEAVTKLVALRTVDRWSLIAAVPLRWLARVLTPLFWLLELLDRILGPNLADALPRITDREIRELVAPGNGEPVIEEHERRLIQRAFLLDQTQAYDIMTPRVDILAWPETLTLADVAAELRAARYSRVPLYEESVDNVTGILYIRDAYQALISGQRDVEVRALAREPFFVPGSVTLDRLLLDFQSRRIHMGIVIDEYGGTDGLITLEDILEELVGEIVDETDIAEEPIVRVNRSVIVVDGSADLREINHFFNTTFPQLEHRSLNGYLLDELGRVPAARERIVREGVLIEVLEATETQVVRARLTRRTPRADDAEAQGDREEGEKSGSSGEEPGGEEGDPSRRSADAADAGRASGHV